MPPNTVRRMKTWAQALAFAAAAFGCAQSPPGRDTFSFALIGDMPYGAAEEPGFDALIADLNADPSLRFVLHAGDIKGGSERCDDALIVARYRQLPQIRPVRGNF